MNQKIGLLSRASSKKINYIPEREPKLCFKSQFGDSAKKRHNVVTIIRMDHRNSNSYPKNDFPNDMELQVP